MDFDTLRIILNIISYLGIGFSFGFMIFAIISPQHRDILGKSFICLVLSVLTFAVMNFNLIFGVKINIPKEISGNQTQEYMVKAFEDNEHIKDVIYNTDGSVTLVMGVLDRYLILHSLRQSFDEELEKLLNNKELKIYNIEHNDDFTEFNISIIRKDVALEDQLMAVGYFMYGEVFNIVKGLESDSINIKVTYTSALNDSVIGEFESNPPKQDSSVETSEN